MFQLLPGFGDAPSAPAPLPPPPTREDPAIADAKEKTRMSLQKRKGRSASILTSGSGVAANDLGSVSRPEARGAQLLGGVG